MKHGDFTGLAVNYSKFRPSYSPAVLDCVTGLLSQRVDNSVFADVGAGTGIWTRLAAQRGFQTVYAVEPNKDMRTCGINDSGEYPIIWQKGSGEHTGLKSNSIDLLTMASSFHWVDFPRGITEFCRALKKEGLFVALWNPRLVRETKTLSKIEDFIYQLKPDIKRVSSGSSEFSKTLYDRLAKSGKFSSVIYLEAKQSFWMSKQHYIGVWKSVNDIQVQLGKKHFGEFLMYIEHVLKNQKGLKVYYRTRAWCARKK